MDEVTGTAHDEVRRPSRRTLLLLLVPIGLAIGTGMVANAIHPTLVNDHPLLLIALEPRTRFLLLTALKISFVPFLLVAVVRRLLTDPLFFILGRLYGDAAVRWVEQRLGEGGGFVRTIERGFTKAAPVIVFLAPGPLVCVLAGASGMNLGLFVAANVVGTVTAVTACYFFADVVRTPIEWITDFYARYQRPLLVLSIALVAISAMGQMRRTKDGLGLDELEGAADGADTGADTDSDVD